MVKADQRAKQRYQEKINDYNTIIDRILAEEKESSKELVKGDISQSLRRFDLAKDSLNLVSYFVLMNSLSLSLLGIKNETYLNEGRKALYKAIIYLEEIVSPYVDVPFSEYEEGVQSLETLSDSQKCDLIKKELIKEDLIEVEEIKSPKGLSKELKLTNKGKYLAYWNKKSRHEIKRK